MKLRNRVAVITGSGSGIGRESALRVAAEGAAVLCADLAKAEEVAQEITTGGGKAVPFVLDVRDASAWAAPSPRSKSNSGRSISSSISPVPPPTAPAVII